MCQPSDAWVSPWIPARRGCRYSCGAGNDSKSTGGGCGCGSAGAAVGISVSNSALIACAASRCSTELPSVSIVCFGLPQPRSSSATAAATRSRGLLSAATKARMASVVCARASSVTSWRGRPPGQPETPFGNGLPTTRAVLALSSASLMPCMVGLIHSAVQAAITGMLAGGTCRDILRDICSVCMSRAKAPGRDIRDTYPRCVPMSRLDRGANGTSADAGNH